MPGCAKNAPDSHSVIDLSCVHETACFLGGSKEHKLSVLFFCMSMVIINQQWSYGKKYIFVVFSFLDFNLARNSVNVKKYDTILFNIPLLTIDIETSIKISEILQDI
jgi:hypothetical protein